MFGCGNYPAFTEILASIRGECIANVSRLRHHPSIVIYAGNNEDYQVQESFGLTYDYEDKNPENWLKTDFPARYIYEKVSAYVAHAKSPPYPLGALTKDCWLAPARGRRCRKPTCAVSSRKPLG